MQSLLPVLFISSCQFKLIPSILFFFKIFYWSIVDLQYRYKGKCFSFIYIYTPLFFRFFPHIGYYGVLNRVPYAKQ